MVPMFLGVALQALLLCAAIRRQAHPVLLWVILAAPVLTLLSQADIRIVSHHGLFHTSIVYSVLQSGFPAENPIWAGQPLHYPYGLHMIFAGILRIIPVAPPWLFASTNILSLAVFVAAVHRASRHLSGTKPPANLLAVTLACIGVSPVARGPLADLLFPAGFVAEPRIIPIVKFTNVNCNQVGLALFALQLMLLLRLTRSQNLDRAAVVWLLLVTVLLGFLYPPVWAGGMICMGLAVAFHLWRRRLHHAGSLAACLLIGGAAIAPWILMLTPGTSVDLFGRVTRNLILATSVLLVPILVAVWTKGRFPMKRPVDPLTQLLLLISCGLVATFVIAALPAFNEYKFLTLAQIPLALLVAKMVAPSGSNWTPRSTAAVLALLLVLLIPFWSQASSMLFDPWNVVTPVQTVGPRLLVDDKENQALLNWIEEQTEVDAIVLDTTLLSPVIARRRMYVGLDLPRRRVDGRAKNGWGPPSWLLERVLGVPPEEVARRTQLAKMLVWPGQHPFAVEALRAVTDEVSGRPVYLVARDPSTVQRLTGSAELTACFQNGAGIIFACAPVQPPTKN